MLNGNEKSPINNTKFQEPIKRHIADGKETQKKRGLKTQTRTIRKKQWQEANNKHMAELDAQIWEKK